MTMSIQDARTNREDSALSEASARTILALGLV